MDRTEGVFLGKHQTNLVSEAEFPIEVIQSIIKARMLTAILFLVTSYDTSRIVSIVGELGQDNQECTPDRLRMQTS